MVVIITPTFKEEILSAETSLLSVSSSQLEKLGDNKFGIYRKKFGPYQATINQTVSIPFLNRVTGPREDDLLDRIDEILEWYQRNSADCSILIIPHLSQITTVNGLTDRGFRLSTIESLWTKEIGRERSVSPRFPDTINIKRIDKTHLKEFTDTGLDGYEIDHESFEGKFFSSLFMTTFDTRDYYNYLCYVDGKTVGTSSLMVWKNFGYLANGAVLPAYRGRRLHQMMIDFRIEHARHMELDYVFTNTDIDSTSGRNMQRNGFTLVTNLFYYTLER